MYKKVNVVMLPTNEKANLLLTGRNDLYYSSKLSDFSLKKDIDIFQHLYFLSDEEIKESDWCLNLVTKTLVQVHLITEKMSDYEDEKMIVAKHKHFHHHLKNCKKIIATTDKSLIVGENQCDGCKAGKPLEKGYLHRMGGGVYPDFMSCQKSKYLTQLPQPSQSFIEHFVSEYNKGNIITEVIVEYHPELYDGTETTSKLSGRLKINSDNTINIKPIKDSWSREEVIELLTKLMKECEEYELFNHWSGEYRNLNKWIEQNL